jgi:hypothetical protein
MFTDFLELRISLKCTERLLHILQNWFEIICNNWRILNCKNMSIVFKHEMCLKLVHFNNLFLVELFEQFLHTHLYIFRFAVKVLISFDKYERNTDILLCLIILFLWCPPIELFKMFADHRMWHGSPAAIFTPFDFFLLYFTFSQAFFLCHLLRLLG